MQVNTVKLLHRAGSVLLCAMALFALGSCRDDLQEPKESTHEQTTQVPLENYIGKVDIALEATLEPMPDQSGRGIGYSLMDRSEKIGLDENTVPAEKDYAGEFAPRMYLTEGSTEKGFLIFYHDSGKKVLRKGVTFTVIEGVKKADGTIDPEAKNRVQCVVKNINFPAGYTLKDEFNKSTSIERTVYRERIPSTNTTKESGWHVMAMLDYQGSTGYYYTADADATNPLNNRLLFGYSQTDDSYSMQTSQSTDNTYPLKGNGVYLNTPCASAWMPLYITKAPAEPAAPGKTPEEPAVTGVNLELLFKPQGVLLQYDLTSMAAETQDLREIGIVSNVLDFKGYYDLNSASIEEAFRTKDGKDYGLPKWVPDAPSMGGLSMHYAPSTEAPLSSGARVFPWDMPTLSSNRTPEFENWSSPGTNKWNVENASVLSAYILGHSDNNSTGRPKTYPWLTTRKLWTFLELGGYNGRGFKGSQHLFYFWGMPRTAERMPQEGKRATYLFASSHSLMTDEDAWNAEDGFDTGVFQDLLRLAINLSNDLDKLKTAAEQAAPKDTAALNKKYRDDKTKYETRDSYNKYRAHFPGPVFTAAKNAMQKASEYLRNANKSDITPRTQPLMVLHQTNRTFPERKVYHAQVVIRPDLMLSEVIYQKHDGKNYSLLEVYNTTVEPVDLSQYAVVRLIPSADGSHLAFRDKDGHAVESLTDALLLPLTALKGNADPFAGSALSSLKPRGYTYDDAANRARPIYYQSAGYTTTFDGFWRGTWHYSQLVDESTTHPNRSLYLLSGQSILLGASGYVNSPVTKKESSYTVQLLEPNGWFKPLHGLLESNYNNSYLRYAYAYADGMKTNNTFGEGTLDYEPGNAFALIKKTSTGWQIIDATGPVGPKHLAFAGSYSDFKAKMADYTNVASFSLQRLDGVDYPFIAPFRTKRLTSKWSDDWNILTDVNQFTPGRRFGYSGLDLNAPDWKYQIKRTPIDTQFTTYWNARPTKDY